QPLRGLLGDRSAGAPALPGRGGPHPAPGTDRRPGPRVGRPVRRAGPRGRGVPAPPGPPDGLARPRLSIGNLNVHYNDTETTGSVVICLHGAGPGASSWSNRVTVGSLHQARVRAARGQS